MNHQRRELDQIAKEVYGDRQFFVNYGFSDVFVHLGGRVPNVQGWFIRLRKPGTPTTGLQKPEYFEDVPLGKYFDEAKMTLKKMIAK